ncbi:MAG: arsenite methyltransferase [Polaribacter sp.]
MKPLLSSKDKALVQTFNEVTLWSGPFGRLLLENIPMKKGMTVLDIGFGTGFPLI